LPKLFKISGDTICMYDATREVLSLNTYYTKILLLYKINSQRLQIIVISEANPNAFLKHKSIFPFRGRLIVPVGMNSRHLLSNR